MRTLEAENAKLEKMLAEQMIDEAKLKAMLGKTSEAQFEEEFVSWAMKTKGDYQRRRSIP
ncbi:hypothetical protein J1C49_16835 [Cognatishimia sp. F0-27]|nr:hypothetical protein [Cognatishimia sp. F0-27]